MRSKLDQLLKLVSQNPVQYGFLSFYPFLKNPTTHSANAWLLSSRTLQQDTWHFENSTYWLLQGKIFNILLLWYLKVLFFPHYALLKSKRSWKSSTNSLCLLIKWGQKIKYNYAIVKVCIIFWPHLIQHNLLGRTAIASQIPVWRSKLGADEIVIPARFWEQMPETELACLLFLS